jgi:predicted kinase
VAVGGVSGTGKSTLAARLAPRLGPATGAVMLRSDVLRKVLLHAEPTERLGPEAYAAEVTEEVYRSMLVRASDLLDEGATVIVDATFLDARWREAVERLARQAGVPFTGVWLEAPPETLAGRLRRRTADVSDATEAVLERQLAQGVIEVAWRRLDAGRDADTVAAAALAVVD